MKLGNHTIGLRTLTPRTNGGTPVLDEYGAPVVDVVDVEVPFCLVAPWRASKRVSQDVEPRDRRAPAVTGSLLLAPPGTPVTAESIIVWPITDRQTVNGQLQLSGRAWQVVGEPGLWDESVEAELRAST